MKPYTKNRIFGPLRARKSGLDSTDGSLKPFYEVSFPPDTQERLEAFEKDSLSYSLIDPVFAELNYFPDIAADIELTSLNESNFNSYSNLGSYLRSIESLEEAHEYSFMSNFSHKLPELDKDSISKALNEIENPTSPMQSAPETEPMETERPDTEEDFLTPITSPRIHKIFPCDNLDEIADKSDWEEIFSQQSTLIEQFVESVESQSNRQDRGPTVGYTTIQASTVRDFEGLQCSTTQCNFAEDREKDRRQRNNMASRKSRAMKKERFAAMQSEIDQLRAANRKLQAIVDELDSAIDEAKAIVLPPME